jgi:serine/threonine protein kinase
MGAVFLARHRESGHQIAIKVMLPQVAADEDGVKRFLREAYLTRALRHRNVVRLRDTGRDGGVFFFTMDFCDHGSVMNLCERGPVGIDEALNVILQVLAGLEFAHASSFQLRLPDGTVAQARGMVHRDLKPSNIFLQNDGAARVARIGDYGLAKAFDLAGLSGYTATGSKAGTPHFMPRQQMLNFKEAQPEVDVWAAAACLYYMLTGYVPRDFPQSQDPWLVVMQSRPVPIRDRNPNVPKPLAEVIDKALIDQPEIFYKTAIALRRALERAL